MTVNELLDGISGQTGWTVTGSRIPHPETILNGLKFFVAGQSSYSNRLLYIVDREGIPAAAALAKCGMSFLYWEFDREPGVLPDMRDNNVIGVFLDSGESCAAFFTHIESLFSMTQENLLKDETLMAALLDGDGISGLVTVASELLGNPLWVTDVNYKYLAMNYVAQEPNSLIRHEYSSGYLADRSIDAVISSRMFERLSKSPGPVYFNIPGYSSGFLACAIKVSGNVVAFITMYEVNRPILESDHAALLRVSKIIALAMQKSHFNATSNQRLSISIMSDLFSGQFQGKDSSDIIRRLRRLGYRLNPYLTVLVVSTKDAGSYKLPPQFILDRMGALLSGSIWFYFQQNAVALISSKTPEVLPEDTGRELVSYLSDCGLVVGMSRVFQNILESPWHFAHAAKALELARLTGDKNCIFRYEEYALLHMAQICRQSVLLDQLLHPALRLLREYDQAKNARLCQTLRVFLQHNQNAQAAAQELFIHKNTLYHRIQQIKDITGLRFEKGNTLAFLELSFAMMDYQRMLQEQRPSEDGVT